jgi:hypothetical protein
LDGKASLIRHIGASQLAVRDGLLPFPIPPAKALFLTAFFLASLVAHY